MDDYALPLTSSNNAPIILNNRTTFCPNTDLLVGDTIPSNLWLCIGTTNKSFVKNYIENTLTFSS